MQTTIKQLFAHKTYRWFLLALGIFMVFLLYSAIVATGALIVPTLQQEHWLLQRPLTRADCVLLEWKNVGEIPMSLITTLIIGALCLRIGYRRRVLPYLLLLLVVCIGIETTGKALFSLRIPATLRSAMTGLTCLQMHGQSRTTQIVTAAGIWSMIPSPTQNEIDWVHNVASHPLTFDNSSKERGYPGGHAMRFCFLGLLMCWLFWKHMRRRLLRIPLMALSLLFASGGALLPFYIGVHTLTDTIAGSLVGIAAAYCAIGLLHLNDARQPLRSRKSEGYQTGPPSRGEPVGSEAHRTYIMRGKAG